MKSGTYLIESVSEGVPTTRIHFDQCFKMVGWLFWV